MVDENSASSPSSAPAFLISNPCSVLVYNNLTACLGVFAPAGLTDTDPRPAPPPVQIPIHHGVAVLPHLVNHGADPAPEKRIHVTPRALPPEIFVVKRVIIVQFVEVFGQVFGGFELVHMDERVVGCSAGIILGGGAHHDRQNIVSEKKKCKIIDLLIFLV